MVKGWFIEESIDNGYSLERWIKNHGKFIDLPDSNPDCGVMPKESTCRECEEVCTMRTELPAIPAEAAEAQIPVCPYGNEAYQGVGDADCWKCSTDKATADEPCAYATKGLQIPVKPPMPVKVWNEDSHEERNEKINQLGYRLAWDEYRIDKLVRKVDELKGVIDDTN